MQQQNFNVFMYDEEQKLNKSKREEVMLRYRSTSPPYYKKERQDEELEERTQNFEPQIHYVVEQETVTQGIRMSRGVESIIITRQETIFLPNAEPIVAESALAVVKVRYNEPKLNQHNGSMVRRIPRDWSRKIHNVNIVPRPNPPQCTYCHQIGH
jgi:hypothetical protein